MRVRWGIMYKNTLVLLAFLLLGLGARGQWQRAAERDTSRLAVHLSTGATVAAGWGRSDALVWTAPSLDYRATDRLTLHAGFAAVGSLMGSYELRGLHDRSLAPRREGTRLMAATVGAEYQATDRLALWASVTRVTGYAQPLWLDGAVPVRATAISGGLAYETSNASLLEFHFHIVHDHYGTAAPGLWGYPGYSPYSPFYDFHPGLWPY